MSTTQLTKDNTMESKITASQLLETLKTQITDQEIKSMVESYERMIKAELIRDNQETAERYALKLASILNFKHNA